MEAHGDCLSLDGNADVLSNINFKQGYFGDPYGVVVQPGC